MQYDIVRNISIACLGCYVNSEAAGILEYQRKSDRGLVFMSYIACVLLALMSFETNDTAKLFPVFLILGMCALILGRISDYKVEIAANLRKIGILSIAVMCGYAVFYYIMSPIYEDENIYILFILIEYAVVKAYRAIVGSSNSVKKGIVIVFPILFIAIAMFLMMGIDMEAYQRMLFSIAIVLVIIFSLTIYNILLKQFESETEEKLLEEQNAAYRKQIDYIMQSNETMRTVRHDMKNHIIAIRQIIDRQEYDLLNEYIKKMTENIESSENSIDTGNLEFDAIVNSKIAEMHRYDIDFEYDIVIPERIAVSGYDMAVIAGNTLDNAIRAVKELKTTERIIRMYMRYSKDTLYIQISNPYAGNIIMGKDMLPVTTKEDKALHGIGVKNINKIVAKYDGELKITAEDNWFQMKIEIGTN